MAETQTGQAAPRVSVGVASKAGYSVVVAGLVGAVLSYLTGNHSQAELGSIVSASVALVSLVITQVGRYVQANSQIRANAELQKAITGATTVVHTLERYDPNARAELEMIVRQALAEELSKLRGTTGEVPADVENRLLPTADEEAADQPPPPSTATDPTNTTRPDSAPGAAQLPPSAASPAGGR